MNKMRILLLAMTLFLSFGLSDFVFAGGGGPEDPACPAGTPEDPLPEPDAGKFLRGDFTVARAIGVIGDVTYSVHITLKKETRSICFPFKQR